MSVDRRKLENCYRIIIQMLYIAGQESWEKDEIRADVEG